MSSVQTELNRTGFLINHNTHLNWSMDSYHFHEFYEVNLVLTDNVSFLVADQIHQAQRGTLFVFSDMDLHRSVSHPNVSYERYVLYFDPGRATELSTPRTNLLDCFINRKPGSAHCVQLDPDQVETLVALLQKAEGYAYAVSYGADIYGRVALTEILLCVNQWFSLSTIPHPVQTKHELHGVLPILQFIQQHLADKLSLDRLAGEFYMNKYHLGELFKRATGFTVNEYIIHRRILRARELLKRGLTVQRVGETVGFNNVSHFIRTFKRLVGVSPKQYQLGTMRNDQSEEGLRS